ncbi:MAG TPA: class I SAM-dependent methyltransferase [Phycisphaerae bacterium]|nr:class I SAM-dependent methyltransferase [Phycisphaerae bacterium]
MTDAGTHATSGKPSGLQGIPRDRVTSAEPVYREARCCRLCGGGDLEIAIELGRQCLTGVFPRNRDEEVPCGPLTLVRCETCGLVQLLHSYDPNVLYGSNYGYRSGLNRSMVEHLRAKVEELRRLIPLHTGDVIVDIGSNDGTTLSFYLPDKHVLVGFDPSAIKFREHYRHDMRLIADFFSAGAFRSEFGRSTKAKVVTSLAMFYDLEAPLDFMRQVEEILADDGVWHFEQSYLPSMLEATAYDTICHEHLEYYAVRQIKWMTDRAGLKIIALSLNNVNGGSFAVTVTKRNAPYPENEALVSGFLREEERLGLNGPDTYARFRERVFRHRDELRAHLHELRSTGRSVMGYGASTKGNVLLQFCKLNEDVLPAIAEVNPHKFGCYTPGTRIPIISEKEAKARRPDCFLVLPWHFKTNLLEREAEYVRGGGTMFFPLPHIHKVTR